MEGKLVTDPELIYRRYIKSWFLIDFVSVLPVDISMKIIEKQFVCSFYMEGCGITTSNTGSYFKVGLEGASSRPLGLKAPCFF